MRRDAGVVGIVPDAAHAELLRCDDFPFVVVAYHPGIARLDAQPLERVAVDRELGLALAELAFDLDMVEAVRELKAHDLLALKRRRPVGDQRKLDPGFA